MKILVFFDLQTALQNAIEEEFFLSQNTNYDVFIYADDMFQPLQWATFRSQDIYLSILYSVNHKIGYSCILFYPVSYTIQCDS